MLQILIFCSSWCLFQQIYVTKKLFFWRKKISAVKSESHSSREAIENWHGKGGKVLTENSIIGSSGKLLIMQKYTDNANGDVPVENV